MKPKYKAIGNMTEALYSLGVCLAHKGIGIPFDPPANNNDYGTTDTNSLNIIQLMVLEAQSLAESLKKELPKDFNYNVYPQTLDGLLSPVLPSN